MLLVSAPVMPGPTHLGSAASDYESEKDICVINKQSNCQNNQCDTHIVYAIL